MVSYSFTEYDQIFLCKMLFYAELSAVSDDTAVHRGALTEHAIIQGV